MSHYKNRKPKAFKGCCGMCACRDHDMGVRNKRAPTMQERRAPTLDESHDDPYDGMCHWSPCESVFTSECGHG